jgi:hypothetical protein
MRIEPRHRWRVVLMAGAFLMMLGGPMHPGGTMAQMLADPAWVPGHVLTALGLAALLASLVLLGGTRTMSTAGRRWLRFAVAATALQTMEMALHTAAVVDHAHLVAGRPTPVLSTHLALSTVAHPLFAAAMIGLIVSVANQRVIGAWWFAPVGIIGVAAHGLAAPLVVLTGDTRFRILFPGLALFALWMAFAALLPAGGRAVSPSRVPATR